MPPRFYAPDLDGSLTRIRLRPDESHHARHVLRLTIGEDVNVFNGAGSEWRGRISAMAKSGVDVDIVAVATPAAEASVTVTVGLSILKSSAMDLAVRDATMLGAASIVPIATERLAAGKARADSALEHWRAIAVASAKQCGRAVVPSIGPIASLNQLLSHSPQPRLICVEPSITGSVPLGDIGSIRPDAATLLIGPEGGWSEAEIVAASANEAIAVNFGPRTLRAETVPAVALSALWTRWGWCV